jgi:hypothetical protein
MCVDVCCCESVVSTDRQAYKFTLAGNTTTKTTKTTTIASKISKMMNSLILVVLLLGCAAFSLIDPVTAFVVTSSSASSSSSLLTSRLYAEAAAKTVELKPEPDNGEELTSVKTMTGSRMKDMGEATGLTGVRTDEDADQTVYKFWLKARVEGPLIKEIHTTVLKDSAKKANFPGFRKGQVPPFAMPQIKGFAVQEGVIRTCQSAVDAYGLKSVNGSDGEVEVLEDIPEIAKSYNLPSNEGIEFTAYFNAIYDPALVKPKQKEEVNSSDDASIIDIDAESTTTTASAEETA